MKRRASLMIGMLIMLCGGMWMQARTTVMAAIETPTATAFILGAVNIVTATPTPFKADDPRPAFCAAPYQSGWEAHIVQSGDSLTSLMQGIRDLSVTQAAALNCIDDSSALPIGSVVWLPPVITGDATAEVCQPLAEGLDCAMPAHGVLGAQQLFQGGMMIWLADTREIWVIANDSNQMQVFADTYVDGEANPSDVPPSQLFVPTRGFGKVWVQLGGQKSQLGWATSQESQVRLTTQAAGRVSYTTYVQLADGAVYAATVLPRQSTGWWVKVSKS